MPASPPTIPVILPEITLMELRTLARRMADMEFSTFCTIEEVNKYINFGVRELYDLVTEVQGHEYFLRTSSITLDPTVALYTLPGDVLAVKGVDWSQGEPPSTAFIEDESDPSSRSITEHHFDVPRGFAQNSVPLEPYAFQERNKYETSVDWDYSRDPDCSDLSYRVLSGQEYVYLEYGAVPGPYTEAENTYRSNYIRINRPASGYLNVWYVPEVPELTEETDSFPFFHGFNEYPALVAAQMMLTKEESDSSGIAARMSAMRKRIGSLASSRDIGHPEAMQNIGGR